MSPLTTDPDDPRLGHGADDAPGPQNAAYLVLGEEERAKGFVRPLRHAYRHVGLAGPDHPLRDLTAEEHERYDRFGYVAYEAYPRGSHGIGKFWTQEQLDSKGCGTVTRMAAALCETYAREPHFYGATYCVSCGMHLPVAEFVWDEDGERVGS